MKRSIRNIIMLALLWLVATDLSAQHFVRDRMLTSRDMIRDIDAAIGLLEKHHPRLYMYEDQDSFHAHLDSLKRSLPYRMSSSEFYLLLSSTIYRLRHGHILLYPGDPEDGTLSRSTLMQLRYEVFDDTLYIVSNDNDLCGILPGTRVDELNGTNVPFLIRKYRHAVPLEGHGGKLQEKTQGYLFPLFGLYETGVSDTVVLQLSYRDSLFVCRLPAYQNFRSFWGNVFHEYRQMSAPTTVRDSLGITTNFAQLRFPQDDHQVAVMQVNSFMYPGQEFYRESFRLLDSLKTRHLILDIRDNMGGLLMQAGELYSYLTDSSFQFIERPIVNSRFRIFFPPGNNLVQHLLSSFLIPVKLIVFSPIEPTADGDFSHNAIEARKRGVSRYRFRGSVSLLVNSGTYSAASLLAANLKHAGHTLVVGEETGGASEGTVAMRISTKRLPASGFRLRYGLGFIQPYYKGSEPGYGVMPDVIVRPSLEDYIKGHDPQLHTILELLQHAPSK